MLTATEVIKALGLQPHPVEGGYFVETYRASHKIPADALPPGYDGARTQGTAIYYLLTPDTFSAMHRLPGDEMFHFYLGDAVEMLQLKADGTGERMLLGADIKSGMRLQVVVPGGVWQGSRLVAGGKFALLGATMSPGFEYEDYTTGLRDPLTQKYPAFREMICGLTREP
jgi:uncharacterized protein